MQINYIYSIYPNLPYRLKQIPMYDKLLVLGKDYIYFEEIEEELVFVSDN